MNRRFEYGRGGGRDDRGGRRRGGNGLLDSIPKPVWDKEDLLPFQKNFYHEHPTVTNRDPAQDEQYMTENRIALEHTKLKPIIHFQEIGFPPPLMNALSEMNFDRPTPIQAASWPILLSGSDLVGIAQTGSGKTLSYLLPGLVQAKSQFHAQPGDGPIILVLAPTRELAQQIQTVANDFGEVAQIRNCCIYGGASKRTQMMEYRKGVELVIATPGRLIDFINTCEVSLLRVTYLVLDEADRMLDMGFEPQIRKIIEQIRPDRQTCMFSATWPTEVRRLANEFLSGAAYVTIGDRELSANHNITQIVEVCSERDKDYKIRSVLLEIMRERNSKTIVFAQTKQRVRQYHRMFSHMGLPVLDIHGDKKQMERERTLKDFREMRKAVLIATDVASRGLDVTDVKFVVNIDYPPQTEDYIHRIGRTARSNHHGTSYTFFTIKNKREAPKLIKVLREAGQPVPDKLAELAGPGYRGSAGTSRRNNDYGGRTDYEEYSRRPDYDREDHDRKRSRVDDYNEDDSRRERKYQSQSSSSGYPTTAAPSTSYGSQNASSNNSNSRVAPSTSGAFTYTPAYYPAHTYYAGGSAPPPPPPSGRPTTVSYGNYQPGSSQQQSMEFSPPVSTGSSSHTASQASYQAYDPSLHSGNPQIPSSAMAASYPMGAIGVMAPQMMMRPMVPVAGNVGPVSWTTAAYQVAMQQQAGTTGSSTGPGPVAY